MEYAYSESPTKGKFDHNCKGDNKNDKNVFTGGAISLSDVKDVLNSGKCPKCNDVYILAYDRVNFNADLDLSEYGNVAVVGLTWHLKEPVRLDMNGITPPNQPKAANGNNDNKDGQPGKDGKPGNPGKHFMGVVGEVEGDLINLTLNVQGSNGQKGQEGGDGKDGYRGWWCNTPENGGNGGNGGKGGVAGKPGITKIYQGYEVDKQLLGYNTAPDISKPGDAGSGGKGGQYGERTVWVGDNTVGENGEPGVMPKDISQKKAEGRVPVIEKTDIQNFYCTGLSDEYLRAADWFLNGRKDLAGDSTSHHDYDE